MMGSTAIYVVLDNGLILKAEELTKEKTKIMVHIFTGDNNNDE